MRTSIMSLLLFCFIDSFATVADTTKQLKAGCADSSFFDGYYVVLYTKHEITDLEKNRQRKLEGKSYEAQFESSILRFFISNDSLAKKNFAEIIDDLPKKNKREVFIECTKDYAESLGDKFCIKKDDLLNCAWPNLPLSNKYFTAKGKSQYCFKIYELSGWFIKFRVDTEDKRDAIGKKIRFIDPKLPEFNAYFFVKCNTYSDNVSSLADKIHLWKEVPPLFE